MPERLTDEQKRQHLVTEGYLEYRDGVYFTPVDQWGRGPEPLYLTAEPPELLADICRECFEWRSYPEGQTHFGYGFWRTCDAMTCRHAHHETEVWIA